MESRESSPSIADLQENDVPIPVWVSSPPPMYQELVRSGQCCICSNGPLKKSSYHPYHHSDTFMGMPAGLRSTKDLHRNLKQLQQTGSSRKYNSVHLCLSSSETSYGDIDDRLISLGSGRDVGGIAGHSANPEL